MKKGEGGGGCLDLESHFDLLSVDLAGIEFQGRDEIINDNAVSFQGGHFVWPLVICPDFPSSLELVF